MSEEQTNPENPEPEKSFTEEVNETASDVKDSFQEVVHSSDNKKVLAGILAIFLGAFGVHKFILGYQKEGIILLVSTIIGIILSCIVIGAFVYMATAAIGLIEGIIYLTKTDEDFYETYQVGNKPWF